MTQLRRTVSAPLAALFDSGKTLVTADLVTITLSGGTALRWTSYDRAVSVDGTTWLLGPGLQTSRLKWTAGTEVDTLTVSLIGDAGTLVNGSPMMPFINGGGLDGAKVQVWRAFTDDPGNAWVGRLHRFTGTVSDIDRPSRNEAVVSVRSIFELLNVMLPRNVYQSQCTATLYDTACGISKAAKTVSGTVTTATDSLRLTFAASGLAQAAGYFDLGAVRITSGASAGVMRTVRKHTAGGVIQLVQPLPTALAAGDTFQVYPGCDRSQATCGGKFSNSLRFRGYPFIPSAESVL